MRRISVLKQRFLMFCLLAVVVCSCLGQPETLVAGPLCETPAASMLRVPRTRTQLPARLDEETPVDGDEAISHERVHSRRSGAAGRSAGRLAVFGCLSAFFAYLFAGVFHGSACPTYGLSRIITFIDSSDGRKRRLFS